MPPRCLYLTSLFLVSFIASCALLNFVFFVTNKAPYLGEITEKMTAYLQSSDQYNAVFIGPSMTAYSINSDWMNAEAQKTGCGMKVYNFGVGMLEWPELLYIIDSILKAHPDSLQYMFFQDPLFDRAALVNRNTYRKRYFLSLKFFSGHLDNIRTAFSTPENQREALWGLVYNTAYNLMNFGYFSRIVFSVPGIARGSAAEGIIDGSLYLRTAGYVSIEAAPLFRTNHDVFLKKKQEFDDVFLDWRAHPVEASDDPVVSRRAALLSGLAARIDDAGYKAGIYIPPFASKGKISNDQALAQNLRNAVPGLIVLHYNEPWEFPDLWQAELWYDYGHLAASGAIVLSENILKKVCSLSP